MYTFTLILLLLFILHFCLLHKYSAENNIYNFSPDWSSLDSRSLPKWYDEAKVGCFLHWGVYSVPSFGSEWFWKRWNDRDSRYVEFMENNYPPRFSYADFAPQFTAEFFNATRWAKLFKKAGCQYVVFTSKHHEGFTMWPSERSFNWNSLQIGPRRNIAEELSRAVRENGLKFGFYYSLYEWFNPMYLHDADSNGHRSEYVQHKMFPELVDLVNTYRPDVLWADGDWEQNDSYWKSREFLAWLYNSSPVRDQVVVNDRWGRGVMCKHGDFFTCSDRYNPGILQKHKWENCFTLDSKSWGHRRDATYDDFLTIEEVIEQLVSSVSCNGNVLINFGPTYDGRIEPLFEERLVQLGEWLNVNGEAIYKSTYWDIQQDKIDKNTWYTRNVQSSTVYAIILQWPHGGCLRLASMPDNVSCLLLGYGEVRCGDGRVEFPQKQMVKSNWAWVVKFTSTDIVSVLQPVNHLVNYRYNSLSVTSHDVC